MYHSRSVRPEREEYIIPAAPASRSASLLSVLPGRLWAGRYWIALAMLLSAIPGVLIGAALPARWIASTQVLIDPADLQVVEKGLKAANPFGDMQIAQVETQGRIITSQNVLKPVVERLGLAADPEFAAASGAGRGAIDAWVAKLKELVSGAPVETSPQGAAVVDAVRSLQKAVTVRRAERTFVLDVSVISKQRDKSIEIANAVVESFLDERANALTEAARRATGSLTERVGEMKARVEIAERAVQDFKRTNDIQSSGGQLVTEQQLTTLSKELVTFRVSAAEAKARYEQLQRQLKSGGDPGATSEAIRSQALAALRAQYGEARGKEGQLAGALMPGHPAMAAARGQSNNIKTAIREEVERITSVAKGEYERASAQERALEASIKSLQKELMETNDKLLRLRELERDAQAQRSVYESFLLRTREIGAQEKLDVVNARVISRAELADRAPFPPRIWQVMVMTMLLGACLATAAVALRR